MPLRISSELGEIEHALQESLAGLDEKPLI
jgi:hypothetical protein